MFTGIVEARGTVEELEAKGPVRRVVIATDLPVEALPLGASIAVDGVCLTVTSRRKGRFSADLGPETLARTTLGALAPHARVHLERPLKLGDALGGHLVSGHVDGVGQVAARHERGGALEVEIAAPAALASTLVAKGSITVDGVSLTVNAVRDHQFSVTLIPHTLEVTGLGEKAVGAPVNLETDLIAKHIERMVDARLAALSPTLRAGGALAPASPNPAPPAMAEASMARAGASLAEAARPLARPETVGLTLETLRKHGFAR